MQTWIHNSSPFIKMIYQLHSDDCCPGCMLIFKSVSETHLFWKILLHVFGAKPVKVKEADNWMLIFSSDSKYLLWKVWYFASFFRLGTAVQRLMWEGLSRRHNVSSISLFTVSFFLAGSNERFGTKSREWEFLRTGVASFSLSIRWVLRQSPL